MGEIATQILIATGTAVVGFIIGLVNNKINLKREVQKERLDKLYIPFVKLYDSTHMAGAYCFLTFQKKYRRNMFNYWWKIKYMRQKLQEHILHSLC